MLQSIAYKFSTMSRRYLLLLLSLPAIFLLTVLILNAQLFSASDGRYLQPDRARLVASRNKRGDSLRFRSEKLLSRDKAQDTVYDPEQLKSLGEIRGAEDEKVKYNGDKNYAFNDLISSRLSLNRAVPDTRHPLCKDKQYRSELPSVSVVVCFYNEAWSTLLRTVHSVLNRTPPHLLYEIVLVDDASELVHLQSQLAEYVWALDPKIKLVRTADRQGLIRARMYGAEVATGEVLVFLDSHCEVNERWLEPLLDRIADNKRVIAIPVIDMINSDNFEYKASDLVKGGFNWGMHFKWDPLPPGYFKDEHSYIEPIETPTMAGGLFAVNRKYFRDMGEYDKDMEVWGGENLEISFRIWQCGGRLEIVPCSRVGHVFRKRRPYGSEGEDKMLRNSVRVARVWMDEYIKHFFQLVPGAAAIEYGNITGRQELRKSLNCHPFQWYLKFIYPDQEIPGEKGRAGAILAPPKHETIVKKEGVVKNTQSNLCLQPEVVPPTKSTRVVLVKCVEKFKHQIWKETADNELIMSKTLCLHASDAEGKLPYAKLMKCHGSKGAQEWIFSIKNVLFQLYNPGSGKCLVPLKDGDTTGLVLQICTASKDSAFRLITDT